MNEIRTMFRAWMRARTDKHFARAELLAWAYLRGWPHERVEPRVSEHNLPYARAIVQSIGRVVDPGPLLPGRSLTEEQEGLLKEIQRWCAMPEERIRRYGPRQKRPRPARGAPKAAE